MKLTGRCLCGNVTYEFEGEPESMKNCHCNTCRRVTGSAFNIGVGVPKDLLVKTGELNTRSHEWIETGILSQLRNAALYDWKKVGLDSSRNA